MRTLTLILTLITALAIFNLMLGCSPDLGGSWDIEVIDGAETVDGEMVLFFEDGVVDGTLDLELYYACGDVHGDVFGEMDGDTVSLSVEFDEWHCEGYIFEFYDIEIPAADMIQDGTDVIELDGDGDWGDAEIRFVATR